MNTFSAIQTVLQEELGTLPSELSDELSVETANRLWLSKSFGKKFPPEDQASADMACLKLFKESNERCGHFVFRAASEDDEFVIEGVKAFFYKLVYPSGPDLAFDLFEISKRFMVGPGASLGSSSYNFYSKLFDGPLTGTSDTLLRLYKRALVEYPTWQSGEDNRFATFGYSKVVGNRLSYVPKTSEISRSICTEPGLNMLFQKGIGSIIESGLLRVFKIDLRLQPDLNRRLARIGSLDGTFGTIDLSSASDSMSLQMLREICPPELLKWIEISRSPFVCYPNGECEELHMVSSMGNGFTFPLQTYLFSSIVRSAYHVLSIKAKHARGGPTNWGVFGDDLTVLKDSYDYIVHCLGLFGFTVNDQKSFNTGRFRESCGSDWYAGHDIRGVYIKSLKHDADVYSAINRLVRWSARTGIFLPQTITALKALLRFKPLWIPYKDGDAEGIKIPSPPADYNLRDRNTGAVIYYALVQRSVSFSLPQNTDKQLYYPRKHGRRTKILFNPSGLLVTAVAGFLRDGRLTLRSERETFKVRKRVTSSWCGFVNPPDADKWMKRLTSLDQGVNFYSSSATKDFLTPGFFLCRGREWAIAADMYFT